MNILISSQSYSHAVNGQATFVVNLAEGLAAAGHQVHVLTPSFKWNAYSEFTNRVHVHNITAIPLKPFVDDVAITPRPGPQVNALVEELQPQVVHIQDHYPLCRSVAEAAFQRGIPVLGTDHFLPINIYLYIPLAAEINFVKRAVTRFLWKNILSLYSRLDLVTAPTQTGVDILRQQGLEVPMQAISCGLELSRFRSDPTINRRQTRLRFGLDPDRILFLYVGRVDREKNLDLMPQVLSTIHRPDIQAAIAGHGNHLHSLQQQARELGLERDMRFTGFIPDPDLPALLNSADVFAMPSAAELQSIATLQAMGTGLPVWAANARALPELVHDGRNGCLFRPDDVQDAARQMAYLADSREKWPQMGAASQQIAQHHDLSRTIKRYEQLYRKLNPSIPERMPEEENKKRLAVPQNLNSFRPIQNHHMNLSRPVHPQDRFHRDICGPARS